MNEKVLSTRELNKHLKNGYTVLTGEQVEMFDWFYSLDKEHQNEIRQQDGSLIDNIETLLYYDIQDAK